MVKALWIRLDVPYAEDADRMRAVLAFREGNGGTPVQLIEIRDCPDIPHAMNGLYERAAQQGIVIDSSLTLVFPLDSRNSIAWPAKEDADRRGIQFARHVPDLLSLPLNLPTGYENLDTGSEEEALTPPQAQASIMGLNSQAQEVYSSGEFLEALGPLRHALWLSLRHFGWGNPGTVYTLRNLGYTLFATGNDENRAEVRYLAARMLYNWELNPLDGDAWKEAEPLIESLAGLFDTMELTEFAETVRTTAANLGKPEGA